MIPGVSLESVAADPDKPSKGPLKQLSVCVCVHDLLTACYISELLINSCRCSVCTSTVS